MTTQASAPGHLPATVQFLEKGWVAQFDCDGNRPQIAQIADVYPDCLSQGEFLLDLVLFSHEGKRLGRVSPALGGPRGFEPACPASRWTPIAQPDFERLALVRYQWGHLLTKLPSSDVAPAL